MRLYNLTPAEARLTLALLEGKGLEWAAEQISLSVNTARTHLKRIFEKTRTHRQAELVRLILRGPAVRRREKDHEGVEVSILRGLDYPSGRKNTSTSSSPL